MGKNGKHLYMYSLSHVLSFARDNLYRGTYVERWRSLKDIAVDSQKLLLKAEASKLP